MRLFSSLLALTALFSATSAISRDGNDASSDTLSIYVWPLSVEKPQPLAVVKLTPTSDSEDVSASLSKYTPPSLSGVQEDIVRIGILDPATKRWTGTAVSKDAFGSNIDRKFMLHVDEKTGQVYHVNMLTSEVPAPVKVKKNKKDKKKTDKAAAKKTNEPPRAGETTVEVAATTEAPKPALNKPIQLNLDGKVPDAPEDNKTFFQKYWWAILLFMAVNLLATGGGGEEK